MRALRPTGADRFDDVARRWRALGAAALADPPDGPRGRGAGRRSAGFAFAPDGGESPEWEGFAPASLVVPELSLARRASAVALTVNVDVAPDDTADGRAGARGSGGSATCTARHSCRCSTPRRPAPTGSTARCRRRTTRRRWRARCERIRAGELEKVVLAREVEVHAPVDHDPAAVLGLLREEFPSCYVFAVGRGDATFLAASPELLVRREGQRASTVALAGSTRRSADPAVDDHLGEQLLRSDKDREENAIVARRIARALRPTSVWVTAAPEPALVRVANIQHLGDADPRSARRLAWRRRAGRRAAPDAGGGRRARARWPRG